MANSLGISISKHAKDHKTKATLIIHYIERQTHSGEGTLCGGVPVTFIITPLLSQTAAIRIEKVVLPNTELKRRKSKQIVKDFENNLFQLKRENVNMILTALKIGHALKTNVLTLASSLSHAEMVLVVKQQLIDRYVVVLPTGQEIHTKNAINVRSRY